MRASVWWLPLLPLVVKPLAAKSVPIPLHDFYNNRAFGSYPGEASLDVLGQAYPADQVGENGVFTSASSGIEYNFTGYQPYSATGDNVICSGQTIPVPPSSKYFSVSFLMVSDVRSSTVSGNVTLLYHDNTTSTAEVRAHAFWWFLAIRRGEITYPYFFTHNSTNRNASHIYERHALIEADKTLKGIVLPNTTNSTSGRLHLFSLSLWELESGLEVQSVRPTQNLDPQGNQLIEVLVNHAGKDCVSQLKVSVEANGVHTPHPTLVKRLCPGDQKKIRVAVIGRSQGNTTVVLNSRRNRPVKAPFRNVAIGVKDWSPDATSLRQHEAPLWYDGAKFGIFIHWGPYSVPSWGNSTPYESYAEWFWWYSTRIDESAPADRSGFNAYRLRTYGPKLSYDDFFKNYTASLYDPKEWVDLFADAGAQYFVFTTKHHDGFANFDTGKTTHRSSLHYGPRRDLLGELFEAAAKHQPHLKRGTYFSLPEWFNPDWGKYGFTQFDKVTSTSQPGIIARNPYTKKNEPYTGRLPIGDFIQDLMVPQMETLAYTYKSDIMWCDAGASNGTDKFAAKWFNWARKNNRQVVINDRCGSPWAADFDTPEYATFSMPQERKWESNQGMDPFSYGFNRATQDDEYMNATTLVHNLVDIASKNGNLLLNIGPKHDGTIHPSMMNNLREAGTWIKAHGEALFNTTYWFITPEENNLRFTQTNDAFYLINLGTPSVGRLRVEAPIPVLPSDHVYAVTMTGERKINWGIQNNRLWIDVTEDTIQADKFAWVFKIQYGCAKG